MPTILIIYASTSGNTEYVMTEAAKVWREQGMEVEMQRAELTKPEDFARGDYLVLASGSWNTGGVEGQMNPHMHELLLGRAKAVDLGQKSVFIVALGDERYFYTARAGEYLRHFTVTHNGRIHEPELIILNDPYGKEEKIRRWAAKISTLITA